MTIPQAANKAIQLSRIKARSDKKEFVPRVCRCCDKKEILRLKEKKDRLIDVLFFLASGEK